MTLQFVVQSRQPRKKHKHVYKLPTDEATVTCVLIAHYGGFEVDATLHPRLGKHLARVLSGSLVQAGIISERQSPARLMAQ